MTGLHPDVAVESLGDHHPGVPRPDLAVRHDKLHAQCHRGTPFTCAGSIAGLARSLALQLLSLPLHVLNPTAHEERLLRDLVVLALADRLERRDRLVPRDEHPGQAGTAG